MPDHGVFWGGGFADAVRHVGTGREAGGGAGGEDSCGIAVQRAGEGEGTTGEFLRRLSAWYGILLRERGAGLRVWAHR